MFHFIAKLLEDSRNEALKPQPQTLMRTWEQKPGIHYVRGVFKILRLQLLSQAQPISIIIIILFLLESLKLKVAHFPFSR
jgi:hypothetical protein